MSSIKFDILVAIALFSIILAVLPVSPFQAFINSMGEIGTLVNLKYVNYFIPIDAMLAVGEAWLACVTVYVSYEYIMRFIKMIE